MKIVQINAVAEYSSTGRTTSELHEALKILGHQSWVAAPNTTVDSKDLIRIGTPIGQKMHSLYSHLIGRQGFASKLATRKFVKKLKQIAPDVVHLRNLHANYINLPILFKYLSDYNIPVVVTLHDCWFFTGHCCYFIDTNCDRWQYGCGNCPDLKGWNKSWFFDRTGQNLRDKQALFSKISRLAVVGVSKWVTSFVNKSILKDAAIIRPIYNWIDTDLFSPQSSNRRMELNCVNEKVVLSVAQFWCRQKGIFDILKLAGEMPSYKFILVGGIDDTIKLPKNVVSIGITQNTHELAEYYSMADVFFNPSSRETFGKVTAEALACGTPVVAYNTTATTELVPPICGELIEIGDINGAKRAIEKVVSALDLRTSCRQFAVETFSKDNLIRQYVELYTQLING